MFYHKLISLIIVNHYTTKKPCNFYFLKQNRIDISVQPPNPNLPFSCTKIVSLPELEKALSWSKNFFAETSKQILVTVCLSFAIHIEKENGIPLDKAYLTMTIFLRYM